MTQNTQNLTTPITNGLVPHFTNVTHNIIGAKPMD